MQKQLLILLLCIATMKYVCSQLKCRPHVTLKLLGKYNSVFCWTSCNIVYNAKYEQSCFNLEVVLNRHPIHFIARH